MEAKTIRTDELKEEIYKRYLNGESTKELAAEYNISLSTAYTYIKKCNEERGITERSSRVSEETKKQAVEDYMNGMILKDICKKYNVNVSAVHNWINKYSEKGHRNSKENITKLKNEIVKKYIEENKSINSLAFEYDKDPKTIKNYIKEYQRDNNPGEEITKQVVRRKYDDSILDTIAEEYKKLTPKSDIIKIAGIRPGSLAGILERCFLSGRITYKDRQKYEEVTKERNAYLKIPKEVQERVCDLYSKLYSISDISKMTGVKRGSVNYIVDKNKAVRVKSKENYVNLIRELSDQGLSDSDIAQKLRIRIYDIDKYLDRYNNDIIEPRRPVDNKEIKNKKPKINDNLNEINTNDTGINEEYINEFISTHPIHEYEHLYGKFYARDDGMIFEKLTHKKAMELFMHRN